MADRNAWLRGEIEKWAGEEIISPEQRQTLLERYPAEAAQRGALVSRLLMGFAAGLVGLALLLFVAANWEGMSAGFKLALIFTVLLAAYGGGWVLHRREKEGLGTAFLFLGTLTFGAGIFLIGQMYHLMAFNAYALLAWAAATLAVAYVSRSNLIFCAALLELVVYDFTQVWEYQQSDFFFLPLMLLALPFLVKQGRKVTLLLYVLALTAWMFRVLIEADVFLFGWPIYGLLLYGAGLWLRGREGAEDKGVRVQLVGIRLAVLLAFVDLVTSGWLVREMLYEGPLKWELGSLLVALSGVVLWYLYKKRPWQELPDVAYFYLVPVSALLPTGDVPLLAGVLFAGLGVWWMIQGGRGERYRLNNGSLFFVVAVLGLYVAVMQDFLGGAAGFLIGGVLLFAVAGLVEFTRRKAIRDRQERE